MQEDDPTCDERAVTEGLFSACTPKKKEEPKKVKSSDEKKKSSGKSGCGCKPSSKNRGKKRIKLPRSNNPFIIFYLKMFFEEPTRKVTEVAQAAAKVWCSMSEQEKEMYIKVARQESARRMRKMLKKRGRKC